jgi:hypothetical protein
MASLVRDPNGRYRVLVLGQDGKRRTIRLGLIAKRLATEIHGKIEHFESLRRNRMTIDPDSAAWLEKLGDALAEKLAAAGLVPERQASTLEGFLREYIERRRPKAKPATIIVYKQVVRDLVNHFGAADIRRIDVAAADGFKLHLETRTPALASATIARRLTAVRMVFVQEELPRAWHGLNLPHRLRRVSRNHPWLYLSTSGLSCHGLQSHSRMSPSACPWRSCQSM